MHKIVLVGAGQIGSRHLQALVKDPLAFDISIVEPSLEAQSMTRERVAQVNPRNEKTRIVYYRNLPEVGEGIDIAIVATGASGRANTLKTLVSDLGVRNLIIEKVLFQNLKDYQSVCELFSSHGVKAWVNCPRRMYPGWIDLKEKLSSRDPLHVTVSGGDWGLACNAVHFIDVAAFLGCEGPFIYNGEALDRDWIPSKRKGYMEINGMLSCQSPRGDRIEISSIADASTPPIVMIESCNGRFIVNESNGLLLSSSSENDWAWVEQPFSIKYQSELTGYAVSAIISSGDCPLTPFAESSQLHVPFIETLISHYRRFCGYDVSTLPIT